MLSNSMMSMLDSYLTLDRDNELSSPVGERVLGSVLICPTIDESSLVVGSDEVVTSYPKLYPNEPGIHPRP